MSKQPTKRQQEVYDYIAEYMRANQRAPTIREIASEFQFACPNSARCHIDALRNKGLIEVDPKTARGIFLIGQAGFCPCCGKPLGDANA